MSKRILTSMSFLLSLAIAPAFAATGATGSAAAGAGATPGNGGVPSIGAGTNAGISTVAPTGINDTHAAPAPPAAGETVPVPQNNTGVTTQVNDRNDNTDMRYADHRPHDCIAGSTGAACVNAADNPQKHLDTNQPPQNNPGITTLTPANAGVNGP